MRYKFFFILILVLGFSFSNLLAQTTKPKTISAGIVNGKATSLPKPEYPADARAAKASGEVKVQITIDEEGNVVSASAISGHPLLRQVSEEAARQAKFTPTKLSGQSVKVTGVIVYNFIEDNNNEEKIKILGLGTMLLMVRGSVSDLEKLNVILETENTEGISELAIDEFPDFAKELAPIATLGKVPSEKRLEIIDGIIASVQNKLTPTDAWQFEMGKNFGEFLIPFMQATSEDKLDLGKLNESTLRANLMKIKDLIYSAPPDFPPDVLEKFKQLATVDNQKKLTAPENLQELRKKLETLFEVISPDSTK